MGALLIGFYAAFNMTLKGYERSCVQMSMLVERGPGYRRSGQALELGLHLCRWLVNGFPRGTPKKEPLFLDYWGKQLFLLIFMLVFPCLTEKSRELLRKGDVQIYMFVCMNVHTPVCAWIPFRGNIPACL